MSTLQSINARTGEAHGKTFAESTAADIDRAATVRRAGTGRQKSLLTCGGVIRCVSGDEHVRTLLR